MMREENSRLPLGWIESSKNTPGGAVELADTITRSAPLITNVPLVGDQRQLAEVHLLLDDVLHLVFALLPSRSPRRMRRRSVAFSGTRRR